VFYQTDPKLQFRAKSDCYIFDILKIHEIVGEHEFTRTQIKQLRDVAVRTGFIGQDGYINERGISGLATVASGISKHYVYIKRVGSNDPYNFLIGEFMRIAGTRRIVHFNLMEDKDTVMFDPWSKLGALTTKEGNIIGYRYLFAEAI